MNSESILQTARERVDQLARNFSLVGAGGVQVQGAFPSYTVSGSTAPDALSRRMKFLDQAFAVKLGEDVVLVTPGVVRISIEGGPYIYEVPTINGVSIFDKPTLPKFEQGGFVWLRRTFDLLPLTAAPDDTHTLQAWPSFTGFEIGTTPAEHPDDDTKYRVVAFYNDVEGDFRWNNFDLTSITPAQGHISEILCIYDPKGKILFQAFGGMGNVATPHDPLKPPGTFDPGDRSLMDPAYAFNRIGNNVVQFIPA